MAPVGTSTAIRRRLYTSLMLFFALSWMTEPGDIPLPLSSFFFPCSLLSSKLCLFSQCGQSNLCFFLNSAKKKEWDNGSLSAAQQAPSVLDTRTRFLSRSLKRKQNQEGRYSLTHEKERQNVSYRKLMAVVSIIYAGRVVP